MRKAFTFLVPALLIAQALFVRWSAGEERPPAPPVLAKFPTDIAGWQSMRDDPIAEDVLQILKADQIMSRTYFRHASAESANLLVTWFASQRSGKSQPHSPKVCLPASGWTPEFTGHETIETSAGPITVNRYVIANRVSRQVVLYWYQTPRRVIAGELEAKLWLVGDAVRDHRTDMALVRVVTAAAPGRVSAAETSATNFAREVYPVLRNYLPH